MTTNRIFAAYSPTGIWGAGETPKQALDEAAGYMRDRYADQLEFAGVMAGFSLALVSPALLAILAENPPGYRGFRLDGETLVPDVVEVAA